MKKTYKIHLRLDNSLLEQLRKEAEEMGVCLSEICRQKLQSNHRLNKIEFMLDKLLKENERKNKN